MSRIGRKPIPLPKGVAVKIEGNMVNVQGPKGKLDTQLPRGISRASSRTATWSRSARTIRRPLSMDWPAPWSTTRSKV